MNETAGQLDIGGVISSTTEIWKQTLGTVWVVALILLVPAAIIANLISDQGVILSMVANLVTLVASYWLAGTVVRIVQKAEEGGVPGEGTDVGSLLGSVSSKIIPLILLGLVVGIVTGIGYMLLIVPGVFLSVILIASVPSMVVEDLGVFDAMGRSSELTKGNRWRILAVGILVFAITFVILLIMGALASASTVVGVIVGAVLMVLFYPWLAIVYSVLYFRLRDLRGEGVGAAVPDPLGEPIA